MMKNYQPKYKNLEKLSMSKSSVQHGLISRNITIDIHDDIVELDKALVDSLKDR